MMVVTVGIIAEQDCFLNAYMAQSHIIKANTHGESIQVKSSSGSLVPVSKVHGMEMSLAYNIFRICWTTLTKNSKANLCLGWGFVRQSMTVRVGIVIPHGKVAFKLHMHMPVQIYTYNI